MTDGESTFMRKKILCRDTQIETLKNFISCPWEVFPPLLLLVGQADTGKTLTVEEVISKFNWEYRIARIDCCSCISIQLLLTSILDQIVRHKPSAENGYQSYCRIDNMHKFVTELKKAARNRLRKTFRLKKIFIILDHSERLVNLNPNLPNFFLRLREVTKLRTTVLMLINKLPSVNWFQSQPIAIHFPQYTKAEMVTIICYERPKRYDDKREAYESYVNMMVNVLYRDLRRLGAIMRQVWAHEKTVMTGNLEAKPMWDRLCCAITSLPLVAPTEPLPSLVRIQPSTISQPSPDLLAGTESNLYQDLPYCTKFMIIAAMLAAHIPPSADAKIFVRARPDDKKRRGRKRKVVSASGHARIQLGPRSFLIDRLFAIFYAIVGHSLPLTVHLQTQVSSLVKLEMLRDVSTDLLTERKLVCAASLDMVTTLARSVDFDLEKYLSLAV